MQLINYIKLKIQNIINFILKHREWFIVGALLIISGIAHGFNMFHYPYYENDEGTYMSQAWAVLTQGKLSHYTYWYDHSPVGWFLIALWAKLTGGFFIFGLSVNSGRVLMLILHLFSTVFLYKIAKKMTGSVYAGIITALIFSLSPLGIYFQRRVLLDNIMVFWLLLSIYLIICYRKRLLIIIISSIAFALAVLSKESGIFFFPAMLYLVFIRTDKKYKMLGLITWITIFGIICSFYPLYALLKGELFPMGSVLDAGGEHVSLVGTLFWQMGREGTNTIQYLKQWFYGDKFIIILGVTTTFINLLLGAKRKYHIIAFLLSFSYMLYLIRGGLLIEFYIIGLVPFLALNIGIFFQFLLDDIRLKKIKYIMMLFLFVILSIVLTKELTMEQKIYIDNQTIDQEKALMWIKKNISKDSLIAITNYSYIDLRSKHIDTISYKNAQWYWKIDKDPEIKNSILNNQWDKIDYIILTSQMTYDMSVNNNLSLLKTAFMYSDAIKKFNNSDYGVTIYKVNKEKGILRNSWQSYKINFMTVSGKIVDPSNNSTTSEGQSYALLRAVWMDDKETFDKVFEWTNDNLKLKENNLFAWSWSQGNDGKWGIRDEGTATDADEDIALALLFAYKKWDEPSYLEQAKKIINNIWKYEVIEIKGKHYLTAGNWAPLRKDAVINPSYLSPYAYRIFAEVDTSHDWMELVDTSYDILFRSSQSLLDYDNSVGLPPDWCAITPEGKIMIAKPYKNFSRNYSYDAIRVPWRIALDWKWNKESRAIEYLKSLNFLSREWQKNDRLASSYSHNGNILKNNESISFYGASLGYFITVNPNVANEIYEKKIFRKYFENEAGNYWNDPENYYEQNWAWFGTAFYANKLPNLWE